MTPTNRHLYEPTGEEPMGEMSVERVDVEQLDSDSGRALLVGPDGQETELSSDLYSLLERMVQQIRRGNAVQLVTYPRDLTTQQAAEILTVS